MQLPETEGTGSGFGKSVAFLIQPVGYTPDRRFAELPNELIGQIDIQDPVSWHEERPEVDNDVSYTYVARTRPEIPSGDRNQYYYRWDFGQYGRTNNGQGSQYAEGWGLDTVHSVKNSKVAGSADKVTVDIEYQGKRISGDAIYVTLVE